MKSALILSARVFLIVLLFSPAARLQAKTPDAASPSAVQLVQSALAAEARGDGPARGELLREAINVDPSYAPAHWHSGEVRVEERWMPIDEAAAATVHQGTMEQYRKLRDGAAGTANAHFKLANWCATAGLKDQERTHLIYANYMRPSDKLRREIVARLRLVTYQGRLMPQAQVDTLKRQAQEALNTKRERLQLIANVKRNIARRDSGVRALSELRTTQNPLRMAVLEQLLQEVDLPADVAKEGIAILAADPGQVGTDAIVRQALFGLEESTRKAAADILRSRSFFAYVPTLIGALHSPIDVRFAADWVGGTPRHELYMYQEGPQADYKFTSIGAGAAHVTVITHVIAKAPSDVRVSITPDRTLPADVRRAQQAVAANEAHSFLNQRIGEALNIATENEFNDVPQWWNWWNEYNEMYQPPRGTVQSESIDVQIGSFSTFNVSCFVAGTPVWTSTGPMPIEQVHPGESVLAQDPDSGELAYKPVLATTVRPPSTTIEIKTEEATIRATKGHPFWVAGIGWQMAKELKAGQSLHSPRGPVKIQSVSQDLPAECFNLVVADFNSYFVSDAQVLVHDNNLREVTTATVPGLVDP